VGLLRMKEEAPLTVGWGERIKIETAEEEGSYMPVVSVTLRRGPGKY